MTRIVTFCRDVDIIEEYSNLWKDKVLLLPTPNDLGAGLAYHLCDVVVAELVKMEDNARGAQHDALMAILSPFIDCISQTRNKILIKKIHAGVFTEVAQSVESRTCPFTSLDTKELAELLFSVGMLMRMRSILRLFLLEKTICTRVVVSMSGAAESLHTALGGIAILVFCSFNTGMHGD